MVETAIDIAAPLLRGLSVTLQVTAGSAAVAAAAALTAGLARLSRRVVLRWTSVIYIEVFRGTSALVQLFWFYFVLPFFGIELSAMVAAILVLGLNAGAYGAEIVRGAITAVPRGQVEAAMALNLNSWQTFYRIVLPQAMVVMLPPAGNLAIELLKNSALVSIIAITELTFAAQLVRSTTLQSTQVFGAVLVLYFVVALCITTVFRALERRLGKGVAG